MKGIFSWLWARIIMFFTWLYNAIKYVVVQIMSIFNDSAAPHAPWSLRRWLAVAFTWIFYKALVGILPLLAGANPPSLALCIAILGLPLLGVIFMLFFTTWESVRGVINSLRGTPDPTGYVSGGDGTAGGK